MYAVLSARADAQAKKREAMPLFSAARCGSASQAVKNPLPDIVHRADARDTDIGRGLVAALICQLLVKVDQRTSLRLVYLKTLAHGFLAVAIALNQAFTGAIVLAVNIRRVVLEVIHAAGARVNAAARQALDDFLVGNIQLDDKIDINAGIDQCLRLRNGAREAVEQEALGTVIVLDALFHQANDDFIGHQATGIHYFLRFQTQRGSRFYGSSQHVTGGDLRNTELLHDELGLSALTGAGCAKQNDSHGRLHLYISRKDGRNGSALQKRGNSTSPPASGQAGASATFA